MKHWKIPVNYRKVKNIKCFDTHVLVQFPRMSLLHFQTNACIFICDFNSKMRLKCVGQTPCYTVTPTDSRFTLDCFSLFSLLKVHLQLRGYSVFLDIERLNAGKFDEGLLTSIAQSKSFILVLTQDALERCIDDSQRKDWVHRVRETTLV